MINIRQLLLTGIVQEHFKCGECNWYTKGRSTTNVYCLRRHYATKCLKIANKMQKFYWIILSKNIRAQNSCLIIVYVDRQPNQGLSTATTAFEIQYLTFLVRRLPKMTLEDQVSYLQEATEMIISEINNFTARSWWIIYEKTFV